MGFFFNRGEAMNEAKRKAMKQQQINREVAIMEAEEKATRIKLEQQEKARLKKAKAEYQEAKYGGVKKVLAKVGKGLSSAKGKVKPGTYSLGRQGAFNTGSGNINFGGRNVFSGEEPKKKEGKKIIIKLE